MFHLSVVFRQSNEMWLVHAVHVGSILLNTLSFSPSRILIMDYLCEMLDLFYLIYSDPLHSRYVGPVFEHLGFDLTLIKQRSARYKNGSIYRETLLSCPKRNG